MDVVVVVAAVAAVDVVDVEMGHVNVGIVGRTDFAVTTEGSVTLQHKGISLRLHWKTAWEATCTM